MIRYSIYKYKIPAAHVFSLYLPEGALILSVQTQYNEPQLWAMVPISDNHLKPVPTQERVFLIFTTGADIRKEEYDQACSGSLVHIGTFQLSEGTLVFHLFEDINVNKELKAKKFC